VTEKYSAYAVYKDSGSSIELNIPESWEVKALKHLVAINMGQSPPSEDCNQDGIGVPFLQGNAEFGTIYPVPRQYCDRAKKVVEKDSYLFSVRAPVGALNIANQQYGIGRGLCALTAGGDIGQRYLYWGLLESRRYLNSIATGSTFEAVSVEQVGNTKLVLPSLEEQTQIAKFLDYETAKIDALIEKQQQLIALLKEKRQAVISHAVTKGLNPDAPMRDSGVEWLGEVPAHWAVSALKRDACIQGGYAFKSDDFGEEGEPVVRIGDINLNGGVGVVGCKRVSKSVASPLGMFVVAPGSIVMAMTGATIGKAGTIPEGETALLNQRVGAFRLASDRLAYGFLWFALRSEGYLEHVRLTADGGAQPNISDTGMLAYELALPPVEEQVQIVEYLERMLPSLDKLIERCGIAVELLQERRTALISAAVTGKIDVRDWKPPKSKPEAEAA
jgi:type I restriction enzyme, S subunit